MHLEEVVIETDNISNFTANRVVMSKAHGVIEITKLQAKNWLFTQLTSAFFQGIHT